MDKLREKLEKGEKVKLITYQCGECGCWFAQLKEGVQYGVDCKCGNLLLPNDEIEVIGGGN